MNILHEFLNLYSYRFEKGYFDFKNQKDLLLLENIINNLIPEYKVNILEIVSLSPTQLIKPFHSDSEFFGQYKDRGERFLENIENNKPFEMNNGKTVVIDKEQSKQAIELLKQKQYSKLGGQNKLFIDTEGNKYSLSNFVKTKEYGAGSGKGGGTEQTTIQESAQCLVNEIAFKLKKDHIDKEDITQENLEKVQQYVDTTSTFAEMSYFILNSETWLNTFIQTANILYSTYPNSNFTSHRGSNFVNKINDAFTKAKKDEGMSLQVNKWNPADIWLVDPSIENIEFKTNLQELNNQINELYKQEKLIGVSLKKLGSSAHIEVFNDEQKSNEYNYETYQSTNKSKMSTIIFNEGKIYLRSFNYADNFAGEIAGTKAMAGKIGVGVINKFLKDNNLSQLPNTKDIRKRIYDNDLKFIDELFELYTKYVENLNKEEFKVYLEKYNEDWKFSKYLSLYLVDILETCSKEIADNLINNIVNYAKSSSSISSTFIKIS